MKLTVKLGLASALSITTVAGLFAAERVNREIALFEDDMHRDHRRFGRALALAAQAVAQRHGVSEAEQVIAATNAMEEGVLIEFVAGEAPRGAAPTIDSLSLVANRSLPDLVSAIPASIGRPGYIRMQEPRDAQVRYVVDTLKRVLGSIVLLTSVSLAIIFSFGWRFLAQPLRQLVDKVRRVGAGDLEGPLSLHQRDEMGVLAREINGMCNELRAAHLRVQMEFDARMRALEQLRHADRLGTVGKLSSGVAHELGTPLNVITARAKMILTGESSGDEVFDDTRVILSQSERMTKIIRQLLDFARAGSLHRNKHDLRALARSSATMLRTIATNEGVDLMVEEGEPIFASVDGEQMQQVLTNIVMNGIQAHEGRAGEVRIRLGRAVTATAADGKFAFIEVMDQGGGMAVEVAERVFEPFFTMKDVGKGTGLGLSVAHGMVQEHGGDIVIESQIGVGTTVRVVLPVGNVDG